MRLGTVVKASLLLLVGLSACRDHDSAMSPELTPGGSQLGSWTDNGDGTVSSTVSASRAGGGASLNTSATTDATTTTTTSFQLNGDYVAAGVGLRGNTSGTITINGIPTGGTVNRAFLYWGYLANGDEPALGSLSLNNTPVTGTLLRRNFDTCWGRSYSYAYRADVTAQVTQNGSYTISGVQGGGTHSVLAQGASLVVVYDNAADRRRTVVISEGNQVYPGEASSFTRTLGGLSAGAPVSAKTTFIAGDGQPTPTEKVSFTGGAGTASFDNSLEGSDGPLWDTDTYDVSGQIAAGDTQAHATLTGQTDCWMWVTQVLSVAFNSPPVITDINTLNGSNSQDDRYAGGLAIAFAAAATDPENDPLTYSWKFTRIAGPGLLGEDVGSATGSSTTFTFPDYGKYQVELTVSDGQGGTDTETTTSTAGHEVVLTVTSPDASTGNVVTTATLATGTSGSVHTVDAVGGTHTYFLSDGGWLLYARNLPDRGEATDGSKPEFFLAVAPTPEGRRAMATSENRNRLGVLYDPADANHSVPYNPANYERLTATPALTLSNGGRVEPYYVNLSFEEAFTLDVRLKSETGQDAYLDNVTENCFVVLPHRDGAILPPRPTGAPGAGLQRGLLLGVGTFAATTSANASAPDCVLKGIPITQNFAAAPVLESNKLTISYVDPTKGPTTQDVQIVRPFEIPSDAQPGQTVTLNAVVEPYRYFVDYIKDPWRDAKQDGDIGMVSYGWLGDANGPTNDFVASAHVRVNSKYLLQMRWFVDGTEQSIRVAVTWSDTEKKWLLLEKSTTPKTLPTGFVVHDPTGYAEVTNGVLEGTINFKVTIPGIEQVELRVLAREEGLSDAAPNSGFKVSKPKSFKSHTWDAV